METQLIKKLKLDTFNKKALLRPAKESETAFTGYDLPLYSKGDTLDLAIAFVYHLEEMKEVIFNLINHNILEEKGIVYLIYPKNKNKLKHPAIHRDAIFPYLNVDEDTGYIEDTEYKFNRMVALDENYTVVAVKFVPKSITKKTNRPSARVNDYEDKVADIQSYLQDFPKQAEFYNDLTPGYQKDWARYVYSAKTAKTQQNRLEEMVDILDKGFKTKQLYRQSLT